MKINQNLKIIKILFVIIFCLSTKIIAQSPKIIIIKPEISKKIIEKYNYAIFEVYQVTSQKIKYHEYENGEVMSDEYLKQLKYLEENKKYFENFEKENKEIENKKNDLNSIISKIDIFLNSNDKYELKKQLLIDSQNIANKYSIKIITTEASSSLVNILTQQPKYGSNPERQILIYNENSRPNKNDLRICKNSINNIIDQIKYPEKTNEYNQYLIHLNNLPNIKKTKPGKIQSSLESEREVKLVNEAKIDINLFSGSFIVNSSTACMAYKNHEDSENSKSFIKDELIDYQEAQNYPRIFSDPGFLIKEINSNEEFFLPLRSQSYIKFVYDSQKDFETLKILHELGYKEYNKEFYDQLKGNYNKLFIKTKTAEIELKENDYNLYNILKENRSILSNFDNDHNKLFPLMKQCATYTNSLISFLNIYKIKRNMTPISVINSARTTVINAKKLVNQIMDIRGKYAFIYSFLEVENNAAFQLFLDKYVESKNVLGIN